MKLKKLLAGLLALVLCLGVMPAMASAEEALWTDGLSPNASAAFSGGRGTQAEPYLISNATDLAQFARNVNSGTTYNGKYFKMTNDIDLSGKYWIPVADGATSASGAFQGHFDGDYNIVSNMKIKATLCNTYSRRFLGLFAWMYKGSLKNIGLENAELIIDNNRNDDSALLLGYADWAVVDSCFAKGNIIATKQATSSNAIGGLVGQNYESGHITNCYFIGNITNEAGITTAGLVGYQRTTVQNCYVAATISTTANNKYAIASRNTNCYYDSTLNTTVLGGQCIAKTTPAMKTPEMAASLSTKWVQDSMVNDGYPYIHGFYAVRGKVTGTGTNYNYTFALSAVKEMQGKFIVALYDDDDRLVGIETTEMETAGRTYTSPQETMTTASEATNYKIMLWSGADTLQPLSNIAKGSIAAE